MIAFLVLQNAGLQEHIARSGLIDSVRTLSGWASLSLAFFLILLLCLLRGLLVLSRSLFGASFLDLLDFAQELVNLVLLNLFLLQKKDVNWQARSCVRWIFDLQPVSLGRDRDDLANDPHRLVSEGVLLDLLVDLRYRQETTGLHLRDHLPLFSLFKI